MHSLFKSPIIIVGTAIVVIVLTHYVATSREHTDALVDGEAVEFPSSSVTVPMFLQRSFPSTNWDTADPALAHALSGGPGKDVIPALDAPAFTSLAEYLQGDSVRAIVVEDGDGVKVYPYNILVWHEIVNDTAGGVPIAVTFCPLCGSAIVYDRTLSTGETTFGVSGGLLESNMIMYDRASESLWQQSTGRSLAGVHVGTQLTLVPFQLLTMYEIRALYPQAQVLSEKTGYRREYDRNPYGGYDETNTFYFAPSVQDARYPAKAIVVVVRVGETSVAVPWLSLAPGSTHQTSVDTQEITFTKDERELTIQDASGHHLPFYFEMWFSFAVQHGDRGIVFDPTLATSTTNSSDV